MRLRDDLLVVCLFHAVLTAVYIDSSTILLVGHIHGPSTPDCNLKKGIIYVRINSDDISNQILAILDQKESNKRLSVTLKSNDEEAGNKADM